MVRRPTIKSSWRGVKGNKWRAYDVTVSGKKFHHQSKTDALRQFNSAKRVYKRRKK